MKYLSTLCAALSFIAALSAACIVIYEIFIH